MKKLLLLSTAALGMLACNSTKQDSYTVQVSVKGQELASDTLILTNRMKGENAIADTVVMTNGTAVFSGVTDTPQYVMVGVKNDPKMLFRFFLENTDYKIAVVLSENPEVKIESGSATQKFIDSLQQIGVKLNKEAGLDSLMKIYPTADDQTKASIRKLYDETIEKLNKIETDYLESHPTSYLALNKLLSELEEINLDTAKMKLEAFLSLPAYAGNKNLKQAEENIKKLEALSTGKIAPDFTQNDTSGNPVKFSDIYKQNKITMVDFWASWCGPCRRFNPTLVQIYQKYHKKGFEILGVSLDNNHKRWVQAIESDHLTWPQVSDLEYWNNAVAQLYMVRFIPQNIIVDQEGKIIKRQASENEIEEILEKYLQ